MCFVGACRSVRSCRVARRRSFGGTVGTASSGSGRQGGRSLSGGCDGSGVAVVAVSGGLSGGDPLETAGGFGSAGSTETSTVGVRIRPDRDFLLSDPDTVFP